MELQWDTMAVIQEWLTPVVVLERWDPWIFIVSLLLVLTGASLVLKDGAQALPGTSAYLSGTSVPS